MALPKAPVPRLLLHSCCAPCSSHVLQCLSPHFAITLLYFNPNIAPSAEYDRRLAEQIRLVEALPLPNPVTVVPGTYDPSLFEDAVRAVSDTPEGGARCERCIELRLQEAAHAAQQASCDFFATTLTISPHKNAPFINACGARIAEETGVSFLPSDFKKQGGFLESIRLSEEYGLYRQDYCGCRFSKAEAALRNARKPEETLRPSGDSPL